MVKRVEQKVEQEIVRLYRDEGWGGKRIAKHLGLNLHGSTIYRVLRRHGIIAHLNVDTKERLGTEGGYHRFSEETEQQILHEYGEGTAITALMERYTCDRGTIARILKRHESSPRRRGAIIAKVSEEMQQEIIIRFQQGQSVKHIMNLMQLGRGTVKRTLLLSGIVRLTHDTIRDLSEEQMYDILERWTGGQSQASIGQTLKMSQSTISRALKLRHPSLPTYQAKGVEHGMWKGGRIQIGEYTAVRVDDTSPFASMRQSNGYVLEHRLVMAEALGRPLLSTETVHHIDDQDKSNNQLSNLQLRIGRHGKHGAYHCLDCGSSRIGPVPLAEIQTSEQVALD